MTDQTPNRRDFVKTTGAAAAIAATGLSISSTRAQAKESTTVSETKELIPGMAAQGKAVKKVYVESDYAPLKACMLGNPSGIVLPDIDSAWDMANMFAHESKECKAYLRQVGGKPLKDADPKMYDTMSHESNSLAQAYRDAGVTIIRNETGHTPKEIVDFTRSWSKQGQVGIYGQAGYEVVGHCLVSLWEVSAEIATELVTREATVEMMKNDPEAVWLSMPFPYPTSEQSTPGGNLSAGDFLIFGDKTVVQGIGVAHPSHIKDLSKPRSSGNEFVGEILRRMLKPYGWKVETVYFNSNLTYHIDCLAALLEEGLMAYPKDSLWTPFPKRYQDWEVMDVDLEDHKMGVSNNEPIGNKRIVMTEGTKRYAKDLTKRGWTCIEVPYENCFRIIGSGIHCSTASIWREA